MLLIREKLIPLSAFWSSSALLWHMRDRHPNTHTFHSLTWARRFFVGCIQDTSNPGCIWCTIQDTEHTVDLSICYQWWLTVSHSMEDIRSCQVATRIPERTACIPAHCKPDMGKCIQHTSLSSYPRSSPPCKHSDGHRELSTLYANRTLCIAAGMCTARRMGSNLKSRIIVKDIH